MASTGRTLARLAAAVNELPIRSVTLAQRLEQQSGRGQTRDLAAPIASP